MLDADTAELVRRFVRRFCAVDGNGEVQTGRFFFAAGETARKAKEARDPVPFGDPDHTIGAVIERIEDLLAAEEGSIWLRAYRTGATHHAAQVKIEGILAPDSAADPYDNDGSLAGALVATNRMLLGSVSDLQRQIERHHQHQLQAVQTVTHLALREGIADLATRQEAVRASIAEFGPVLAAVAPAIVAHFTGGGGGGAATEAPPSSPAEHVQRIVQRIGGAVAELGAVLQAAGGVPAGSEPSLAALRDTVLRIGPALGLVVTPIEQQAGAAA